MCTIAVYFNEGRFPFDQIFRFEIPGIPCNEWNIVFRFVGLTRPRSSSSKFRENRKSNGRLFYLCPLGLVDDFEVKINDVLDKDDNITFIVRIQKESATTLRVRYL